MSTAVLTAINRRSSLGLVAATIRDPVRALPPEVYEAGLVRSRAFGTAIVHVTEPALVHELLVGNADMLGKTPAIRRALGPALGEGLLTSDGHIWRWQRRTAAPAFWPDSLSGFVPSMIAAAQRAAERLACVGSEPLDLGREMMRTTFDIIGETMLSGGRLIDVDRVAAGAADYLRQTGWALGLALLRAPGWVPYPGRRRGERAAGELRRSVETLVAQRRASGERREDLVDRLLAAADPQTGSRMDDTAITDNLLTFIAAGHETTALGLAWTLDLLARHADAREQAVAEVDGIAAGGILAPDHLERLPVLRQVFQEAMRLFPPAPLISREALRPVDLAGSRFPAGTRFIVPIYAIHRHRALWADPERFDPSRFEPSRAAGRPRLAYMPFGAGPRVCIGAGFAMAEAVVILATLLGRFRFEPVDPQPPPARMAITLRPGRPLRMRVRRR